MTKATVVLVVALGALGCAREKTQAEKLKDEKLQAAKATKAVQAMTKADRAVKASAEQPCDHQLALDAGEELTREKRHAEAVTFVDAFLAKCGEWPRLLWVKQYAFEELGKWKDAAANGMVLVRSNPQDSDFWWWKGRSEWKLKHWAQAESDFLQSMTNKPTGYPAARLKDLAEDEPAYACSAAFLLQYLVEQAPARGGEWAPKERSALWLKGNCAAQAGTGKTTITFDPNAPVVKTQAAVNGVKGTFLVGFDQGLTVVTRAFAEKAKVAQGDGEARTAWVSGDFAGVAPSAPVAVQLGQAKVAQHPVGLVDTLPDGIDGVLGLSTLNRFSIRVTPGKLALSPIP